MAMYGDTSIDMMLNVLPGSLTGIFALNAGLSSINQQFQNMTKAVDNHFGIVDATIVAATALVVQFAKGSADAFGEYEQGMKIVQAVSGQSSAAIAELGQKANEFSVQYRMDITDLTEGLQTLGRAGLKSASEQTEVLESGLQTAKLEGRDLNSVLEELIQNTALLGGNLKSSNFGEQSEYVNDLLVATSMTAPINTHDVSETLKYSGGIAAAAGANIETNEGKEILEDYMGAIAAFAQKGVKGSIAGTALRAFFNKPATQDSSVVEGLGMIGLKPEYLWEDDQETMKPISEQISLIQSQMKKKGISKMDQLQIWSKIVGGKMGQQMMKLEGSDIREITKDIQEANSAENLATQSMQTYQASMKQTSEAAQLAYREFGEHVARFLTPISQALTPILQFLSNPAASTAFFAGFLKMLSLAWNSIKKVFAGIKSELGIIKAEFRSLVLNQPQRRGIMDGRMWGGGTLKREVEKAKAISTETAKVKQEVSMATSTGNQGASSIVAKLEHMRSNLSAAINKTKEFVIEINEKLSSGVNVVGQRANQVITETSGRISREYSSSVNGVINTGKAKIDSGISSSASKMRTEFQAVLNSLTYNPKIKTGPGGRAVPVIQNVKDTGSKSFGFYNQLEKKAQKIESDYQERMTRAKRNQAPLLLHGQMKRFKTDTIKEQKSLEKTVSLIDQSLNRLNKDIAKQDDILRANVSQSTKLEAQILKEKLMNQKALYEQEKNLYLQEIAFKKMAVREIDALIVEIRAERLALKTGRTTHPIVSPVGGGAGPVNMSSIPSAYQPNYTMSEGGAVYSRYNLPYGYRPTTLGGDYTSPNFKNLNQGQGLLANLRQQEIAMTKEMQQELGITNKELIRFYEELIQVNAALAKTTTVANGRVTTRNGMTAEQKFQEKLANDTLYKTKGNLVPIHTTGTWTARDRLGLKALFGDLSRAEKEAFEKMYNKTDVAKHQQEYLRQQKYLQTVGGYTRYNLPPNAGQTAAQVQQGKWENQRINEINSARNPAAVMTLMNQMKTEEELNKQKQENLNKERERIQKNRDLRSKSGVSGQLSRFKNSLTGGTKGLKGLGNALSKTVNFMGGPFFAVLMGVDVAMQVYTALHNAYIKKVEEATNKIDEMAQAVDDAENVFFNGKDEEGEAKITGWLESHPDATAEEKEDALLGAYSEIYDHSNEGLSSLDANTQQLAIATEELKIANDKLVHNYLKDSTFGPKGAWDRMMTEVNNPRQGIQDIKDTGKGSIPVEALGMMLDTANRLTSNTVYNDKFGNTSHLKGDSLLDSGEIQLDDWQKSEEYPWSQEFSPIIASEIWRTGSTAEGLKVSLGEKSISALKDQYSSFKSERKLTGVHGQGGLIDPWEASAWNVHGRNMENYFSSDKDQANLQMGLQRYSKDFSKLAKQMRRFEKATGKTALGSLRNEFKKTRAGGKAGDMKKALKNLQVTDPKLVSYIKSLSIKTGMDAERVLMAAQLQQLQDMKEIADTQVTPRMESLVGSAFQQVAYGGQTLSEVGNSGAGAVSAADNAAAIAALLNAKMESTIWDKAHEKWIEDHPGQEDPYGDSVHFAAAAKDAKNKGDAELSKYFDYWATTYAATNKMMNNASLSIEDATKMAEDWYSHTGGVSASGITDTLRKGGISALRDNILSAYDLSLDQEEGGGSGGGGGGSGSGDKDKNTGTRRERVDLVLCNKKEIPKLNVNLFKKPPSFTILNKNFKLRDVKINSEDKPKAIMAAIKNSFIDIQKRTDPKIIQDEDAVYDPKAATDGTNLPSGSAKTKTDNN